MGWPEQGAEERAAMITRRSLAAMSAKDPFTQGGVYTADASLLPATITGQLAKPPDPATPHMPVTTTRVEFIIKVASKADLVMSLRYWIMIPYRQRGLNDGD